MSGHVDDSPCRRRADNAVHLSELALPKGAMDHVHCRSDLAAGVPRPSHPDLVQPRMQQPEVVQDSGRPVTDGTARVNLGPRTFDAQPVVLDRRTLTRKSQRSASNRGQTARASKRGKARGGDSAIHQVTGEPHIIHACIPCEPRRWTKGFGRTDNTSTRWTTPSGPNNPQARTTRGRRPQMSAPHARSSICLHSALVPNGAKCKQMELRGELGPPAGRAQHTTTDGAAMPPQDLPRAGKRAGTRRQPALCSAHPTERHCPRQY